MLSVIWILVKLRSYCLIETSQSTKYGLAKDISKPLNICIITQSKCHWWYMLEFVTECNQYLLHEEETNNKQFWITYCTMVTNVNWWWCSQISLIQGLIFELLALNDYGYSQTKFIVFFIFLAREVFSYCLMCCLRNQTILELRNCLLFS